MMLTTDLSMRMDPKYDAIAKRWKANPAELAEAFGKAWYKLLHRDMGPVSRLLGPYVPEAQLWQDPVPKVDHALVEAADIKALKQKLVASGVSIADLVFTAWASAASFRGTDKRGGANGARIRLSPQKDWAVNEPARIARSLAVLERVQREFNATLGGGKKVSLADVIVLGGCAAIEKAASDAGVLVEVPFTPGRTDATQEQTDVAAAAVLEPTADGFRNYVHEAHKLSPETLLLDRANYLRLTAPQMTVLVGGLRVLGANHGQTRHGVLTDRPGKLTNDFFVNLLDARTEWRAAGSGTYEGRDASGKVKWTATAVDLVFGSNAQLRALAEVYASSDANEKFVRDFAKAFAKVTNLDRYDVKGPKGRPLAVSA
jgi:catalase-peroxidase